MAASWAKINVVYRRLGIKLHKTVTARQLGINKQTKRCYSISSVEEEKQSKSKQYTAAVYTSDTAPGDKKDTRCDLPAAYSPQYVEAAWYDWWVNKGYFSPKLGREDCEKFVVCLPPPNVTGTLHLGHALTCSIQDALVRWHRMNDRETVWVPGCDHAGIATQVVVEKQLWKDEQKRRQDLGREEFLKRVWSWKESKGSVIYDQMKRLGASLDWSREYFTMDENMSKAVTEAFVRLYDEGCIYRSNRLVHWSCILKSAISDMEVENITLDGPTKLQVPGYDRPQTFGEMMSFDYPILNTDGRITVSTTRLETMLGDVAVCVHPDDSRFTHLRDCFVAHPIDGRNLPIICDTSVDMAFGTGAVKITPAHDHNDYVIGITHQLPFINVINDAGEMENVTDKFNGMKRFDARREVVKELKEKGLFVGKQAHSMVLPVCSRSKDVIEPRMKAQWFVNCEHMTQQACQAVENGDLTLMPEFYNKVWYEFMKDERSREWCVSRQTWWGHRIPVYKVLHKRDSTESVEDIWTCTRTEEEAYCKVESEHGLTRDDFVLEQDEDVLDTWFSSALVPFSIQGWPHKTEDLRRYYPISLMETGNDILFFWVARMVMMGYKMTGTLPFNKVLLHGLLRDAHGRKMSKSLGNVIDPMDVIHGVSLQNLQQQVEKGNLDPKEVEKAKLGQKRDFPNGIPECGADALRFALCSYNFKDPEINMNILHVQNYRHFCNKIWQGFRFVSSKLGDNFKPVDDINTLQVSKATDRWILSCLSEMVSSCEKHFENYELHNVTKALYNFWWNEFCDIYLEYSKEIFMSKKPEQETVGQILHLCTGTFLRAVSPMMPYLSEELYQRLTMCDESICIAEYPVKQKYPWYDEHLNTEMCMVRDICTDILSLVQDFQLKRNQVEVIIEANSETCDRLNQYNGVLTSKLLVKSYTLTDVSSIPDGFLSRKAMSDVTIHLNIGAVANPQKLVDNFEKRISKVQQKIEKLEKDRRKHDESGEVDTEKRDAFMKELQNFKQYIDVLKLL